MPITKRPPTRLIVVLGLLTALSSIVRAEEAPLPFVSPIFGDNMVLQRDKPNPIWGWAKPGTVVRVELAGRG